MEVQGAVALITGGASGLGAATARRLAKIGASVVIVDRDANRGAALAAELGGGSSFAPADVTDATDIAAAVEQAVAAGPLRVAVNCAGIGWAQRTIDRQNQPHSQEAFEKVVAVNLFGTFNVLRQAAAAIAANDPTPDGSRGVIVNTASIAAYDGQIGQIAYAASKGGVVGLTLPAARDLAAVGIRVCTIAPGLFDTPLLGGLPEPQREALAADVPFPRRLGQPDDYAALVEHIVTNAYLNGETIRLDAGLRMAPK